MKQKIVIKVSMKDSKSRTKAMKIAVGVSGVTSAELQGAEKDQIVVAGEGIDSTKLTTLMRKKVGNSDIVSVTPIPEKKEEKKQDKKDEKKPAAPVIHPMVWPPYQQGPPQFYYPYELVPDSSQNCTIM